MKIIRNKAFLVCSILFLMIAVSGIGVFTYSYFTDRTENSELATAGTVDIELDTVRESNLDKVGIDLKNNVRQDILNPGDLRQASFGVYNKGNKSVDVRNTIVINSTKEFSEVDGKYEFELYDKDAFEYRDNGAIIGLKEGASPVGERVLSDDKKTITYTLPDTVLNGNEDLDEREVEEGIDSDSIVYDYKLVFRDDADNDFQGSIITISVISEAKQHRNTSAGWEIVTHDTVSFDDLEYSLAENNGYGLTEISVNDWTIAKYNYDSTPMVYENTVKYTDNQIVEENKKQYVLTEFEGLYGKKKGNQTYLDTETGNLVSITYQEDGNTYTKMKKTEYPNRKLSESQYNGQPVYITGEFTYEEGLITDSGILHKTMTISGSLNEYINGDVVISTDNYIEKGNSVYDDLSCDAPDIMNQKGIHISMYQDSLNGKYLGEIIMNEDRDGFMAIGEKYSPYPNNKFGTMKIADGEDYAYYILIFYDYTDEEIGNFPGKYAVIQYYQDSVRSKNKLGSIYVDISELNNLDQYLDQFRPDGYYSGINITDIPTSSINAKTGLLACTVLYTKDYEQQVDPTDKGYFTDYEIESTTGKVGIVEGSSQVLTNGNLVNTTLYNRGNKSVYMGANVVITVPVSDIEDPESIAVYNPEDVTVDVSGACEVDASAIPYEMTWEQVGDNYVITVPILEQYPFHGSSEFAEFEKVPADWTYPDVSDSKQLSFYIVDTSNTLKNISFVISQDLTQYENDGSFYDEWISEEYQIYIPETTITIKELLKFDLVAYSEGIPSSSNGFTQAYECGLSDEAYQAITSGLNISLDIEVPETYNGLPVVGISGFSVGEKYGGYLKSIKLPDSILYIGEGAFSNCSELKSIDLPEQLHGVGYSAFWNAGIEELTIPSTLTSDYGLWFSYTPEDPDYRNGYYRSTFGKNGSGFMNMSNLKKLTFSEGITIIDTTFDSNPLLSEINLPDTLKEIDGGTFGAFSNNPSLESIDIPDSVISIGNNTFSNCTALDNVIIPDGVTELNGTFNGCTSLTNVKIGNSVTTIINNAFRNCSSLESIFIPNSVVEMSSPRNEVFKGCTSLIDITIDNVEGAVSGSYGNWGAPNRNLVITYLR